ncbi:putative oxidoreductase [Nymphaea thermarum]|nr:putative oxidoreductase [Nymphaea thermarum]
MELQTLLIISATLALFHISKAFLVLAKWVWASFLRPVKDLKEYGSWAIVTGPTDGIGKQLAFLLAGRGLNLVLVGRNPSKLSSVSNNILKLHSSTEIKSIVVDLGTEVDKGMKKIKEGISGLDIGILINNAGTGYPYARFLHEADEELVERIIRVNVESTTKLTHLVLPDMLKKKKGAIVNIGSGAGSLVPSYPLNTIYASTKAYIAHFSKSLHVEYKQFGIDVQCQVPMFVATKMVAKKPSFLVPRADEFAKSCMDWIGHESLCVPYWPHFLHSLALSQLPDALLNWWLFHLFLGLRKKAQMKDQTK